MAVFFLKKIAKIVQRLGALPQGAHKGNLFSSTQSSQPAAFKIVITGFLNKQML